MRSLDRARKALSGLFRRGGFTRAVDVGLRRSVDLAAEGREHSGTPPAQGGRAPVATVRGIEPRKERRRSPRLGAALDSVGRDVRFSLRLLRRNPSFATTAILTIALGTIPLAATAALANWLFFRPAPGVTNADRLVHVEFITHDDSGDSDRARISYQNYADLIRSVNSLTGLAGYSPGSASIAQSGVDALHVDVDFVTPDYFEVLGARMMAGRPFAPDDERQADGIPVVILGHGLARTLFGDPGRAPGRSVLINGLDFTVVGVAPQEFRGLTNDHYSQVWLLVAARPYAWHLPRERWNEDPGVEAFVGRLAADVELEQARIELTAAARGLANLDPVTNRHFRTAQIDIERQPGMSFSTRNVREEVALMVTMFAFAGALLLLLTGANVGNLLLFRGARRRDEMAMRSALGASRWRLLRAHVVEVSLISLAGSAMGLLLMFWLGRLLEGVVLPEAGLLKLPIDWRVAGVVLGGSVLVSLIFGAAPTVIASSGGGVARTVQGVGTRPWRRLRSSFTVMQLAISLSLLVSALLLLVTIRNLVEVDLGFEPTRIASAGVSPRDNGYDDVRLRAFYRDLLDRVAAIPAVTAVSVSSGAPVVGTYLRERVQLPGGSPREAIAVVTNSVTADYFRVLALPLLRGRGFSADEAFALPDATCGPVVVSEALALRLFGTRDVLDRIIVLPRTRPPMECRIVGVAANVRNDPAADWERTLYRPLGRSGPFRATVLVRSDGPLQLLSAALRKTAASLDPAMPLYGRASLAEAVEFQTAGRLIISSALGLLALVGLLIAAVGLYGLVAETVMDRTREFAVRMAVGAPTTSIFLAVLRHAIVLAGIGIAIGMVLSVGSAGAIRSQLFDVADTEPWVHLSAAALLATVVVLGSLGPAVRAMRTNPAEVLHLK